LLQAGVDLATIALWLGHESVETTQIYLDANLAIKEQALAKTLTRAAGNYGFPSGHVGAAAAFFLAAAWFFRSRGLLAFAAAWVYRGQPTRRGTWGTPPSPAQAHA